mgnify:CR=1 FL=1
MKKQQWLTVLIGALVLIAGIVLVAFTRAAAIAESATAPQKMSFAVSLILALLGLILVIAGLVPERRKTDVRTLATAAMFAALCYVGFAVLRIDIPVGTEKTAFHLGNVFCVLGALFLGGFWGGMAGAVGMTIADLTTAYVTSAPKTLLLKQSFGLTTGLVALKVCPLSVDSRRKTPLPVATVLSCAAGLAFNVVADPLTGYFYKRYLLGVPQEIATIWAKMGALTTLVNAVIAIIAATVLYLALRPALKRTGLYRTL